MGGGGPKACENRIRTRAGSGRFCRARQDRTKKNTNASEKDPISQRERNKKFQNNKKEKTGDGQLAPFSSVSDVNTNPWMWLARSCRRRGIGEKGGRIEKHYYFSLRGGHNLRSDSARESFQGRGEGQSRKNQNEADDKNWSLSGGHWKDRI